MMTKAQAEQAKAKGKAKTAALAIKEVVAVSKKRKVVASNSSRVDVKQKDVNKKRKLKNDEIDSIFAKPSKPRTAASDNIPHTSTSTSSKPKPTISSSNQSKQSSTPTSTRPPIDDFGLTRNGSKALSAAALRQTEDGFHIYAIEDLRMGEGGDTDLCPFDCDCCR